MNTKTLWLGLLIFSILIVGCTKNVYYTSPTVSQPPEPRAELPLLSSADEQAIIKSWSGLNTFHRGTEEFMSLLKNGWKLNVLKLYKGELIFRGQGYNYLFVPELAAKDDIKDFSPKTILMFEGMSKEERLNFIIENIQKSNGSWVRIAPGGDGMAAAFDTVKDIEQFLDWWSTL